MSDAGPVVVTQDEQSDVALDLPRWGELAAASLTSSGVDAGELNLIFVDEATMTELNGEHMGVDGPTDVLSFPIDGDDHVAVGTPLVGDVVLCPAYASRHAPAHAGVEGHDGSVDDELALLIVHGVLHLLGHDHAEPAETARMRACEQELLAAHHRA